MSRALYIGDVHAVADELAECRALIEGVVKTAAEHQVDRVVFLGDVFNNMSAVRVEVFCFWQWAFATLVHEVGTVLVLVGNHDLSNDGTKHVLGGFPEVYVIEEPTMWGNVLHLPYMKDKEEFVRVCELYGDAHTLVCHQAFDGSQYENGHYAGEEGVAPWRIPQHEVIAGHVHKPSQFGKVWHPGAPRWRSPLADANEDRAVWVVEHAEDGSIVSRTPMDTSAWCRRIVDLRDTPEAPADVPTPGPLLDVRVEVRGPTAYVLARAAELGARGVRVRTVRTDAVVMAVRESEGVGPAWTRFSGSFRPSKGTAVVTVRRRAARDYGLGGCDA